MTRADKETAHSLKWGSQAEIQTCTTAEPAVPLRQRLRWLSAKTSISSQSLGKSEGVVQATCERRQSPDFLPDIPGLDLSTRHDVLVATFTDSANLKTLIADVYHVIGDSP